MSLLSPAYKKKLEQLKKAEGAANLLDLKLKDLSTDAALLAGSSLPPPFGTAADVASLAKSVASGDWGGAFWDAVGFIPIVGDGAKAAVKGTKIARRLKAINKSLDKARDAIRKKKEDLGKLCKKNRKDNKGKVTQATKDCGTNCGGGKNLDPPEVRRKIPKDKLKYKPKKRGDAPIGEDGKPVELHHTDQSLGNKSPRDEMTMTDHRGKGNFKKNHPNIGQKPSTVDRAESGKQHKQHWKDDWDSGRFDNLPDKK